MRRLMMIVFFIKALQQVVPLYSSYNRKRKYYISFPFPHSLLFQLHLLVYCDRSQETSYAVLSSIIITLDDTIFLSFFLYFFSLLSVLLALLLCLYYYDQFKFSSLHHRQFFPSSPQQQSFINQSTTNGTGLTGRRGYSGDSE